MKIIKLAPNEPYRGFVSLFTGYTEGVSSNIFKYIKVFGEINSGWANASTVIDYSISCSDPKCQWVSPSDALKNFIIFKFFYPICLTHYTMRTRVDSDAYANYPVSWIVESAPDNETWKTIDTKSDRSELRGNNKFFTYTVENKCTFEKYIKIHLKKTSASNVLHFHLSRIEFFGEMKFGRSNEYCMNNLMWCKTSHAFVYIITIVINNC